MIGLVVITARKRSYGKAIFLHLSVILSTTRGRGVSQHALGQGVFIQARTWTGVCEGVYEEDVCVENTYTQPPGGHLHPLPTTATDSYGTASLF